MTHTLDKKIVMVVAFKDFRDEEYFIPKSIFEKAGAEVITASNKKGEALGADGGQASIDYLIQDLDLSRYQAVIFVGGPGCLANLDNDDSYKLAKETVVQHKLLGAICVSPVILARAGILKNKKATVWSSDMDKSAVEILRENGAQYLPDDVVHDGLIVTSNGPEAAEKFANALVEELKH
jgi:protease I